MFYKAWAFALSGFIAGVAGALLAGLFGQLDAGAFPTTNSIMIFIGTLLGGYEVWLGAFLGGLLTRFIPALLIDLNVNTNVGLYAVRRRVVARLDAIRRARRPVDYPGRAPLRQISGAARTMIKIDALTVQFGGITPLDALDAQFDAPICGLIGPNGAGKTTLVNVPLRLRHAGPGHDPVERYSVAATVTAASGQHRIAPNVSTGTRGR